ncbi:MAG: cytochrome c biogenesis protein CcdA, partial [Myxococcota bacterium]
MRCRQYSPPRSSLYSLAVLVALPLVLLGGAAFATGLPEGAVGALGGIAQEMASCTDGTGTAAGFAEELRLKLTAAVASGNLFLSLLLVLLAGFGVTLTPCVYPLIPITLSLFGARSSPTKLAGFLLSLTYVSGMVLLYSGLGIGFALAGKVMGAAMQHPVVTAGVALFCLAMAASMFGAFELALPPAAQQRLAQVGGSGFRGAFLMGLVAGLIAAPCTGPVLSFILTLIAVDGDIGRGALFMVVFSLGVGLPFLVLGTFSSAVVRIPKTGAWTEAVKGIFGLLMVAAGLYFLTLGAPALLLAACG